MQRFLAVVLVAGVAGTGAAAGSIGPTLSLVDRSPVVLHGQGFRPGERVRVTVATGTRRARDVSAGTRGGFVVRFASLSIPHCGGAFARARGSAGSVALLKIPLPACQAS